MTRKPPVRHKVRTHKRDGKTIRSFTRGTGKEYKKPKRVVMRTHYVDKYGTRKKIPATTRGMRLKVASNIRTRVEKYARRMGLDPNEIKYKYVTTGRVPAHMHTKFVRPSYEVIGFVLKVNTLHFGMILSNTPHFYDHYMDYMVAHELGHMKQVKEIGVREVESLPQPINEDYADEWAYKISGRDPDYFPKRIKTIEETIAKIRVERGETG